MADEAERETETELHPRDATGDVRDAIASLKGEAPEQDTSEPLKESQPLQAEDFDAPKADARTRAADGKFIPKSTVAAPEKAAPETLPAPEDTTKASPAQPSTAVGAPPVSWAADAKSAWASLPPAIQTAVLKREDEASRGFRQYSEQTKAYERALAPVAQEAARFGLNTEDGIKRLLDGQRFLETQPAEAILWLAQKHGLNLAELATNPPAPQMPARSDAVSPQVMQTVSSLQARIDAMDMHQNMSAVEQFAQANPHYADVEDQLPDLMTELKAANPNLVGAPLLKAAYDRAIWLNESVREKLMQERITQTTQAQTAKVAQKANQAQRAAVSIKGSSADTRPPAKPVMNGGSVYDDVRASIASLRSA